MASAAPAPPPAAPVAMPHVTATQLPAEHAHQQSTAAAADGHAAGVQQAIAEPVAVSQPAPPPRAATKAPVSKPAAPAASSSSSKLPLIAAGAVAAATLIAAGVGFLKATGSKKGSSSIKAGGAVKKAAAGASSSSRPSSRSSAAGAGARRASASGAAGSASTRAAGAQRPSSGTRRTSAAGARKSAASPAATAAATAAAATTAAAAAAAPAAAAAAAAPPAPAPAAAKPAPAAAPAPTVAPSAAPAAAAPAPPATAHAEPAAPTTPAVAAEAAPEAPVSSPIKQEPAAAAAAPAAPEKAAEAAPAPAAAVSAEAADIITAAPAAAVEAPAKPAAVEADAAEPADAPATGAGADAGAAKASAAADAAAEPAADAADAAAANGDGNEDLIELAEGETLPVVDEAGNQLGTLHHDGRVLDAAGTEIGGLDEEGNVVLYEQGADAEESMILSPAEEEAEQLMRQAAVAWNVHRNRDAAEKLQRKALEAVTKEAGAARPEIVAEVASSLADMMYATQKLTEAKDALQIALDAAEAGGQYPLFIKLTNNMGAVLRKQELHEEGKALHEKALALALEHFGVAHATATLARGNLVDALDQLGQRGEARALLTESIAAIDEYAASKEAEEAAAGSTANGTAAAANGGAEGGDGSSGNPVGPDGEPVSDNMASMMAVDGQRARTAAIRAQIELARLEMKDKAFSRAVEVLEGALATARAKFGEETAEASSVMAALATCHRQAGALDAAAALFERLYGINERQSEGGAANQSGVMLARTLADVHAEGERYSDALVWAERVLELMSKLAGVPKSHPALEQHINLLIELKQKSGDEAGADELRKDLLKSKAKLVAAAQRAGATGGRGGAAAAAGGGGRANGAAAGGARGSSGGGGKKGKARK